MSKSNLIERGGRIDVWVCSIDIEIEFLKRHKKLEFNHEINEYQFTPTGKLKYK